MSQASGQHPSPPTFSPQAEQATAPEVQRLPSRRCKALAVLLDSTFELIPSPRNRAAASESPAEREKLSNDRTVESPWRWRVQHSEQNHDSAAHESKSRPAPCSCAQKPPVAAPVSSSQGWISQIPFREL